MKGKNERGEKKGKEGLEEEKRKGGKKERGKKRKGEEKKVPQQDSNPRPGSRQERKNGMCIGILESVGEGLGMGLLHAQWLTQKFWG